MKTLGSIAVLSALILTSGALYGNEKASDKELQKFAVAYTEVIEIRKQMGQQMSQVESQEQKRKLNARAREKMQKAIKESGLTVPRFNQLAQALNSDKELQSRFQKLMKGN